MIRKGGAMAQSVAIQNAIKEITIELQEHEEQAERLRSTLALLNGKGKGKNATRSNGAKKGGGRHISAKGRAAIGRAAKKRWAEWRAKNGKAKKAAK